MENYEGPEDVYIRYLRDENKKERQKKEGTVCVVCDRYGKQYKRMLHSTPGRLLIALLQLSDGDIMLEFHLKIIFRQARYIGGGSELCKLAYWLLAVQGHDRGFWKITQHGVQFAKGYVSIPKYVVIYNQVCLGYEDEIHTVSICDVLGKNFNYEELMSR